MASKSRARADVLVTVAYPCLAPVRARGCRTACGIAELRDASSCVSYPCLAPVRSRGDGPRRGVVRQRRGAVAAKVVGYSRFAPGRIAQRESARFTRGRSLVRSQVRPSLNQAAAVSPDRVILLLLGLEA